MEDEVTVDDFESEGELVVELVAEQPPASAQATTKIAVGRFVNPSLNIQCLCIWSPVRAVSQQLGIQREGLVR